MFRALGRSCQKTEVQAMSRVPDVSVETSFDLIESSSESSLNSTETSEELHIRIKEQGTGCQTAVPYISSLIEDN